MPDGIRVGCISKYLVFLSGELGRTRVRGKPPSADFTADGTTVSTVVFLVGVMGRTRLLVRAKRLPSGFTTDGTAVPSDILQRDTMGFLDRPTDAGHLQLPGSGILRSNGSANLTLV